MKAQEEMIIISKVLNAKNDYLKWQNRQAERLVIGLLVTFHSSLAKQLIFNALSEDVMTKAKSNCDEVGFYAKKERLSEIRTAALFNPKKPNLEYLKSHEDCLTEVGDKTCEIIRAVLISFNR
jgi:hypothetical protein